MFASFSNQLKIHCWSTTSLEHHATYQPQSASPIVHASWCNDNSYLAILQTNCKPQIVSSKDRNNIYLIHTVSALKDVSAIAFKNHTKRNLAMGSKNGDVMIYDTKMRVVSKELPALPSSVNCMEFNCVDSQLGCLCEDNVLIFYDLNEPDANARLKQPAKCTAMKFHPTKPCQLAVGCENGFVSIWDSCVGTALAGVQKHKSDVTGIGLSENGKCLVTGGRDYKICVFDNMSNENAFVMSLHHAVTALDMSPDDKQIAVGLEDGSIYVYDVRNHLQPLDSSKPHSSPVNKICYENGPRDTIADGNHCLECVTNSSTTINESEFDFPEDKSGNRSSFTEHKRHSGECYVKCEAFDKLKKDMMKLIKAQTENLETQLKEHCLKFQNFIDNEFDSIHHTIQQKWDVFQNTELKEILSSMNQNGSKTCLNGRKFSK